jgi:hypothetical protein
VVVLRRESALAIEAIAASAATTPKRARKPSLARRAAIERASRNASVNPGNDGDKRGECKEQNADMALKLRIWRLIPGVFAAKLIMRG